MQIWSLLVFGWPPWLGLLEPYSLLSVWVSVNSEASELPMGVKTAWWRRWGVPWAVSRACAYLSDLSLTNWVNRATEVKVFWAPWWRCPKEPHYPTPALAPVSFIPPCYLFPSGLGSLKAFPTPLFKWCNCGWLKPHFYMCQNQFNPSKEIII